MRKSSSLLAAAFVGFLFCVSGGGALASSHTFYEGKTIRMIAGFAPGGTIDLRARLFARHLPKWIPGKPLIIVQNMPGAGGLVAGNYAFVVAKPDGLTLLHFPASTFMDTFIAGKEVPYDIRKISVVWALPDTWLGVINPKTSQVKTARDLIRAPVRLAIGGTGADSLRSVRPKLAMNLLGVAYNWVTGYSGSSTLALAFDRGEIHMYDEPLSGYTTFIEPREKGGTAVILWQTGFLNPDGSIQRSPLIPTIPTFDEMLPEDRKRGPAWEAWKAALVPQTFQSAVGLAPGVPADRIDLLSQAFRSMTQDPAYREDFERVVMMSPNAYVGSEADRLMKAGVKLLFEDYQEGVRHLQELPKK